MSPTEAQSDGEVVEKARREGELDIPDPNNVSVHAVINDGRPDTLQSVRFKSALPHLRALYKANRSKSAEQATREWSEAAQHVANIAIQMFLESLPPTRRQQARRQIFPIPQDTWANLVNRRPMFFG